jgi:hypothetical protein
VIYSNICQVPFKYIKVHCFSIHKVSCQYRPPNSVGVKITQGERESTSWVLLRLSIMAVSCLLSITLVYLSCLILRRIVSRPSLHFSFSGTFFIPRASLTLQLEKLSTFCSPVICSKYLRFLQVVDLGSSFTSLASSLTSQMKLGSSLISSSEIVTTRN